jgi:outer membrane protein OmpA-like peptidoglycan-associated protein
MSTPLPATGTPGDITALLTPDGILNPAGVLNADSVNDPDSATPQAALAASSDRPTARQLETGWSDAHPGGKITLPATGAIDLWNFDVASTGLKPEHIRALEQFIRPFTLQPDMLTAVATGYASTTGDGTANFRLASRRAQAVADWCARNGMPGVIANNGGFPPGDDGESFARARSVHLKITGPPVPPPPVRKYSEVL